VLVTSNGYPIIIEFSLGTLFIPHYPNLLPHRVGFKPIRRTRAFIFAFTLRNDICTSAKRKASLRESRRE